MATARIYHVTWFVASPGKRRDVFFFKKKGPKKSLGLRFPSTKVGGMVVRKRSDGKYLRRACCGRSFGEVGSVED